MSATHSVTMANVKPEEGENSLWQGYSLQTPTSESSQPPAFVSNYPPGPGSLALPFNARQQKETYRPLDISSMTRPPPPRDGEGILTASPPSLDSHHSFPSLKRPYVDDSHYGEIVQTFREDLTELPKPSINQDHRLLSFSKHPEKRTILNNQGRVHQLELTAQIHGMFFLSEMTPSSTEGMIIQPELTCYRRNLFQISGTVTTPRGPLSVVTDHGERVPVTSMEVTISASESVDGHAVKLIVIPWKTPPPNSPEVGQGQEHEPTPIPLQPFDESGPDVNSDFSVYPIAYRRLQFRIATANNGRRRELQQHFTLHLNVVATLASGVRTNICETSTAQIVVRGRSPRNFQARKEIPLVGSSSSRGGPPDLHITTSIAPGMTPASAPVGNPKSAKPKTLELPRSAFSFDTGHHLPPSPNLMRTQTYPPYVSPNTADHSQTPNTPSYQTQTAMGIDNYLHVSQPTGDMTHLNSPSSTMPRSQPLPLPQQPQYPYQPTSNTTNAAPIRFIDNNPRPTKSPRHAPPPEPLPLPSYSDYGARFAPPYSGPGELLPPREPAYFPSHSMPMPQSWTTAAETSGLYGTTTQAPTSSLQHHYQFPNESYAKDENNQSQQNNYTWNPS